MGQVENYLLSGLPSSEYHRLLPAQERVTFSLGEVVYESSGPLEYVYFPTTSVVSLLYTMEDGVTAEMGLVGNDGVVGVALFLGGDTTPNRAVVQIAGEALRMRAKLLQAEFAQGGPLQHLLLLYSQALITQISQTAVCNRVHSVEKRLCRWLLLSMDRVKSDELPMTQEFISNMLRTPRERYRGGRSTAECWANSLCSRPHKNPRSEGLRSYGLRMLPDRQDRIGSLDRRSYEAFLCVNGCSRSRWRKALNCSKLSGRIA